MADSHFARRVRSLVQGSIDLRDVPLFGLAPTISLEEVSRKLQEVFHIPSLRVSFGEQRWRNESEIAKTSKEQVTCFAVFLSPITEPLFWIMENSEKLRFLDAQVTPSLTASFVSSPLCDALYQFLLLQTLDVLQDIEPIRGFNLQVKEEENKGKVEGFCIDVRIETDAMTSWGRLVIPASFRTQWIDHFSAFPSEMHWQTLGHTLQLDLSIRMASFVWTWDEWNALRVGDFILLKEISKKEASGKKAYLVLSNRTLFEVSMQGTQCALVAPLIIYEEVMHETSPSDSTPSSEESVHPIGSVPLNLHVEMYRFKMSLEKLMQLEAGNVLELPVDRPDRVDLVLEGKKVGVGEIVSLGDVLGIRILQIGASS